MIDYVIVGAGIAGVCFAETCLQNGRSVVLINDASQNASRVAAGLYNPVILKRFSSLENAQEQLDLAANFYSKIEAKLQQKFDHRLPILRKFFSIEEQNDWFAASDKPGLKPFLSTNLVSKKYSGIESPFGYGEVLQTGYVDTAVLLDGYQQWLSANGLLQTTSFVYSDLEITADHIQYQDLQAKNIVFAEGFGIHANPLFNDLPLDGTKGELFIVQAEGLDLDVIVNTSLFVLPLGNRLYKIGATYNWQDKTNQPSEEGKQELLSKITEILNCDFEVIEHLAGVRPTVKDRKPLLGSHREFKNVHILNGLGTRGVMQGPMMAKNLFDHIEHQIPLNRTYDIKRFEKS